MASEDMSNLIAKLQMQAAQVGQPSFAGIQAPVDPGIQNNILQQIQQQNLVDQAGSEPGFGEWNPLFNAGKKDFQRAANAFGDAAQQGANVINGGSPSSPQSQVAAQQKQAILQAKQVSNAIIAQGGDPNTAQAAGLKILANAGIDVSDLMGKNQEAQQKILTDQAGANKNNAEAGNYAATQANADKTQTREQALADNTLANSKWTTVGQGNGYAVQRNANGEMRSVKISDSASAQASQIDPAAIQRMVDEKLTTGQDPKGLSKAGLLVPYQNALAQRLDQTGDTQGAANMRSQMYKSAANVEKTVTGQIANTQTAGTQIEKNIDSLKEITAKLGGTGSPMFQKAVNQWNQGVTGDKDTAQAIYYMNELQSEMARVGSNSFGNAPLSDSAKADAKELINKSMIGTDALEGIFSASRRSYLNKMDTLNETRDTNRKVLGGNAPGSPFGSPQTPQAPASAPSASPAASSSGWGSASIVK